MLLIIGVLYSTLGTSSVDSSFINDKFAHFGAFVILMGWFSGLFRPNWFPLLALLLVAFGVGIELLQSQLTHRTAEVADALFDGVGILIAWIVAGAGFGGWAEFIEARLPSRND